MQKILFSLRSLRLCVVLFIKILFENLFLAHAEAQRTQRKFKNLRFLNFSEVFSKVRSSHFLAIPYGTFGFMPTVQPFLLQNSFDCLIDSFIENKVGITESFLSELLSSDLKQNLLNLYTDEQMRSAGIGNNDALTHDKRLRSDKIYWLDRAHGNIHENAFFDLMDTFVAHLNRTCFTRITGYEFHYAMYEKGSFYKKHLDQFRNNKSRVFSMIMYLNVNWELGDGGELCIYHVESSQMISPTNGKCVFFKSDELEHEVLLTQKPRLSITGWLKSD